MSAQAGVAGSSWARYDETMDALAAALAVPEVRLLVAAGYLLGSIPFGLLLARLVVGADVRDAGSGNIGATNVARVAGKKLGLVTLVLDACKGAVPVVIASRLTLPSPADGQQSLVAGLVAGLVGLAAVAGHCFPLWLALRGGKGVATALGVLLALRPDVGVLGIVVFAVVVAAVRRVSAGSVAGAAAVIVGLLALGPRDVTLTPLALCALIILAKHHGNIRRLLSGRELKV